MKSELLDESKDEEDDTKKTKKMTQEQDQVTLSILNYLLGQLNFWGC